MTRDHGHLQVEVCGRDELVACGIGIAAGQLWQAREILEGRRQQSNHSSTPLAHIESALGWMLTAIRALT